MCHSANKLCVGQHYERNVNCILVITFTKQASLPVPRSEEEKDVRNGNPSTENMNKMGPNLFISVHVSIYGCGTSLDEHSNVTQIPNKCFVHLFI
jgi:hypothetical protein